MVVKFRIEVGEVPAMKALTKDSAVERKREARVVGEGEGIVRSEGQWYCRVESTDGVTYIMK